MPVSGVTVATVVDVHSDNTTTVMYPDGSFQRMRGTSVAVGQAAFVRGDSIEGIAPSRTVVVIDV